MIDQARLVPNAWRRPGSVVAIIGLGKSGVAAARLLAREGVRVYASDASDHPYAGAAADALKSIPEVDVEIGTPRSEQDSPGRRRGGVARRAAGRARPHRGAARGRGDRLGARSRTSSLAALQPGTRSIAITGTNGKTTTTALVAHLLSAAGLRATHRGQHRTSGDRPRAGRRELPVAEPGGLVLSAARQPELRARHRHPDEPGSRSSRPVSVGGSVLRGQAAALPQRERRGRLGAQRR